MRSIVNDLLTHPHGPQHDWRELAVYFTEVNQNLVLHLVGNGLKTHFIERLQAFGSSLRLDSAQTSDAARSQLNALDAAIATRDAHATAHCITEHFAFIEAALVTALAAIETTQANASQELSS